MKQIKLDPEDLTEIYFDRYNEDKISDNPCLCLRWVFNTCRNNHKCDNPPDNKPCNDFTMREDEAMVDPKILKERHDNHE